MKRTATSTASFRNPKFLSSYTLKPSIIPPEMCLIVDTREQHSPLFIDKPPKGLMVMRDCLRDGDYGIRGLPLFAIEKKYHGDLPGYCTTEYDAKTRPKMERFKAMIDKGGWVGLVIEERESDIYRYQEFSNVHPESIRGALVAFQIRYGIHVYFSGNREGATRFILDMASKYYRVIHEV